MAAQLEASSPDFKPQFAPGEYEQAAHAATA
jgi:hypothetical protein